jgi:hypothetical protein
MSLRKVSLLLAGGLFFGSPAYPISRVGTCGVGDTVEGFSVDAAPAQFRDISEISNSGVQLSDLTPEIGIASAGYFQRILVYPMHEEYPELVGLDRTDFINYLKSANAAWTEESVTDPCIEIMTITNGNLRSTVASWGQGKGIAIQSQTQYDSEAALQQFLSAIQLDQGACGW